MTLQTLSGTTRSDGTAEFASVARAIAGTPVLLEIASRRIASWIEPDRRCAGSSTWTASANDVVSQPDLIHR